LLGKCAAAISAPEYLKLRAATDASRRFYGGLLIPELFPPQKHKEEHKITEAFGPAGRLFPFALWPLYPFLCFRD
jgi:hypothetical protein